MDVDRLAAPAGLLADGFVEGDGAVGEGDGAEDDAERVVQDVLVAVGVHFVELLHGGEGLVLGSRAGGGLEMAERGGKDCLARSMGPW